MADRKLSPAERRANASLNPVPSSNIAAGAGADAGDHSSRSEDMNMHTRVKAETSPQAIVTGQGSRSLDSDADILALWRGRQELLAQILKRGTFYESEQHSPDLLTKYDQIEEQISEVQPTTATGALAQAWVAWAYVGVVQSPQDGRRNDMIRQADFAALDAKRDSLDFGDRCLLEVVRTLSGLVEGEKVAQAERVNAWEAALTDYLSKRHSSDSLPDDAPDVDETVNAYCEAMDHLIENVPAPTQDALTTKIDLALERSAAFPGLFDDHKAGIVPDLERLATPRAGFALAWLDRWTRHGGDVAFDYVDPNKVWLGQPMPELSPDHHENEIGLTLMDLSKLSEPSRDRFVEDRRTKFRGYYEGSMRELSELLDATPDGITAVKQVLRVCPRLGRPRTTWASQRGVS